MITAPVKRKKQVITSPYGMRNGKMHKGIDLRCVNFTTWIRQPFVACEDAVIIRMGRDRNDNGYIVLKPLESDYKEIKYIHINVDKCKYKKGDKLKGGDKLGYSEIRGQSKAHHLHWEIWDLNGAIDPVIYMDRYGI
jgi:murein DD-endopeptidase MepM/ murein hydrolase activator NlpD